MKKILALLAAISLGTLASTSVVACGLPALISNYQFVKINLSNSNIFQSLTHRIDYQNLTYAELNQKIKNEMIILINQAGWRNQEFTWRNEPILGQDYLIEQTSFETNGDLLRPSKITVWATENSRFFTGTYSIAAYVDLNNMTEKFAASGNYQTGEQELRLLMLALERNNIPAEDYQLTQDPDGSWAIHSNPTGLLNLDFEYSSHKANISQTVLSPILVNTPRRNAFSQIALAVEQQYQGAKIDTDFFISGTTINNGGGYLQVDALEQSKLLTGGFKVFIEKINVSETALATPLTVLNNQSEINQAVINQIHQIHPEMRITNADFKAEIMTNVSETSHQRFVRVTANEESKLIKGTFEFNLEKVLIETKIFNSTNFVGIASNDFALQTEINRQLNSLLIGTNGNQVHGITSAEYTIVPSLINKRVFEIQAKETSEWITGTASTNLKRLDLSKDLNLDDSMLELVVGEKTSSVIDPIIAEIKKKVSWAKLGEDFEVNNTYGSYATEVGEITIRTLSNIFLNEVKIKVIPKHFATNLFDHNLKFSELEQLNSAIVAKLNEGFASEANIIISPESFVIFDEFDQVVDLSDSKNWKAGNYFVKPTDEGDNIWSGQLSFVVDKASFSNEIINVDSMEVGDNFNAKINYVLSEIQNLVGKNASLTTADYEIIDSSNQGKIKGIVEIKAKPDSTLIQGSITFAVETIDVSEKISLEINQQIQWSDLKSQIRQEIQEVIFKNKEIYVSTADFINTELSNLKDTDLVTPGIYVFKTNNSKIIHGEFEVKIGLISINDVSIANKYYRLNEIQTIESEILAELHALYSLGTGIEIQRDDFVIYNEDNEVVSFANSSNWNGGTYRVEPSTKGNSFFTGSFTFVVDKISLSDKLVKLENIYVGDDYQAQIDQFSEVINKQIVGLAFEKDVDYKIEDLSNGGLKAGTVTITTVGSKRLTGSISFEVMKKSIAEVVIEQNFVADSWSEINVEVQKQIQEALFNTNDSVKVQLDDFEILNTRENGSRKAFPGTYVVQAKPTSKLIEGNFTIKVGTLEINNSLIKVEDLQVGDYYQIQIDSVLQQIVQMLGHSITEGIDYEIINSTNEGTIKGEIIVQAKPTSRLINGSVTIKVLPKTITGTLPSFSRNDVSEIYRTIKAQLQGLFANSIHSVTVSDDDFVILDANNKVLDIMSPAGTYVVKASENSQILIGEIYGDTTKYDLSNLTPWIKTAYSDVDRDVSYLHSVSYFEDLIKFWINSKGLNFSFNTANENWLVQDKDYVITGTNLTTDNVLSVANTITVSAKPDNQYITGSFSFEITPVDLSHMELKDFAISNAQIDARKSVDEIKDIIARDLNNKIEKESVKYGVDFEIDNVEDWTENNLTIKISAPLHSNYFKNDISILKIKKLDLTNFESFFQNRNYILNKTSLGDVKKDVQDILMKAIPNSWIKPTIGRDYEIQGDNLPKSDAGILETPESNLFQLVATNDSLLFNNGQIDFGNVGWRRLANGEELFNLVPSNYLLTTNSSTFSVDSEYVPPNEATINRYDLDETTPTAGTGGDPIAGNQVLGMSKNILITTRAMYLGPISFNIESRTVDLTSEGLIGVTDYYVLTTKGSFIYRDITSNNPSTWLLGVLVRNLDRATQLNNLNREDFLYFDDDIIVTTRGVYHLNFVDNTNRRRQDGLITQTGLPTLTKNNFVKANRNFVMTTNALYLRTSRTAWEKFTPNSLDTDSKTIEDIVEFSDSQVIIKDWGLFVYHPQRPRTAYFVPTERLGTTLATTNSYTVTDKYVLYSNFNFTNLVPYETNISRDDILGINDNFLITTKGIYYKGVKVPNQVFANGLRKEELLAYNETFVVTTKGIQFLNSDKITDFVDFNNQVVSDLDHTNDIKISARFLAISGIGAWGVVITNQVQTLTRLEILISDPSSDDSSKTIVHPKPEEVIFTAVNDNFLLSDSAIWSVTYNNTISQVRGYQNSIVNGTLDNLLLLKGKILVTKQNGIFYLNNAYWASEGPGVDTNNDGNYDSWTLDDIIFIGKEGQLITKYKTWIHWQQSPVITV